MTAKDLEKRPATNDISEVLRTMPGVNLTGNPSTGQRGNKRQIDIRGMGRKYIDFRWTENLSPLVMQNVMVCVVNVIPVYSKATGSQVGSH